MTEELEEKLLRDLPYSTGVGGGGGYP